MNPGNLGSCVPKIRPHIQRRDRELFFLISRRPLLVLDPEDLPYYEAIDGRQTVGELERLAPDFRRRLLRWHEAGILELVPPCSPPPRPHLVVIEPHMDDAALSVGGRLLHRRGQCRITILSVVKWSNFTSYLKLKRNFIDVEQITKLRLEESALAAALLGAEHQCLDWFDGPLRFWPPERWSQETIEVFNAESRTFAYLFPDRQEVLHLAEQLHRTLAALAPDELWIPMGLGDHMDHHTTRNACFHMLSEAREQFASLPVFLYEDLPYAAAEGHAAQILTALKTCGAVLHSGSEDISDVFEQKMRAISVYASQFKRSAIEPEIRQLALQAGNQKTLAESFHQIESLHRPPSELSLARSAAGLKALASDLLPLIAKREDCRRLTLLALPSGHLGRWKHDQAILAQTFPKARLHLFLAERLAWQIPTNGSHGVSIKSIRGGWKHWAKALLREWFHFRTPTVILWWGAHQAPRGRILMRCLLPFRRLLFSTSLREFCGVLVEVSTPGASG